MSIKHLPNPDEVQEAIGKFVPSSQAFNYFKRRGILIAANSRECLGEFGKLLFLDFQDYEELHDLATTGKVGQSISGFDIHLTDEEDDDAINVKDEVAGWLESHSTDQIKVEDLRETDSDTLQGRLVYTRRVPGKYELVGTVESKVEFELSSMGRNKWHLKYFPEKITDQQQFKEIISQAVGNKCDIDVPQFRGLPQGKRIEFFDRFLHHRFQHWTINDVVGVKVKEPEPSKEEDQNNDNTDDLSESEMIEKASELERKALGSIREAVLKGDNLRTNPFVKQFEQDGYYFQSMTFRFDHNSKPIGIDLVVNFKLRPVGLEIAVEKMFERVNEQLEESALPTTEEARILEVFWSTANNILGNLRRESGMES